LRGDYTKRTIRWRFQVSAMKVSLRRIIAISAAYAVALQGLLALSVIAAHIAGAADHPAFALCAGAGFADDHGGRPGKDQAHCLELCLAAANAAGCDPDGRGGLKGVASLHTRAASFPVLALPLAVAASVAHRPRAPPA
jgi:hypothetical protein